MRIDVLTLFPEVFGPFVGASIVGRAQAAGKVEFAFTNVRDFARDRHRTVDDKPFGGGPGMVLMCGPVYDAYEHVRSLHPAEPQLIMLTPQGERLTQRVVEELAQAERLALLCGHYEGFDERIREGLQPREISIGDYVLSGGEGAALVLIDAVVRLLPGAVGCEESVADESFSSGLLEYPQYTRPRAYRGMEVPEILVSGDHGKVAAWRHAQALARTQQRRPDLLGPDGKAGCDSGA
ncbi:MAG TPA: tRNA (guanosine(37)-N1)-methyltransferase TrmD [Phycisphaerae bacterium]|nr:tRNA (guanosine(37)-N1)-methyltransferase TrmD [Phycisphaerales bacterium]HRX87266.1 tRNA (guanosine(37)-N1)-methyltransferase TrmD [Phycisphaerae bacterium]